MGPPAPWLILDISLIKEDTNAFILEVEIVLEMTPAVMSNQRKLVCEGSATWCLRGHCPGPDLPLREVPFPLLKWGGKGGILLTFSQGNTRKWQTRINMFPSKALGA